MKEVAYFGCLRGAYGHREAGHHLYRMVDGRLQSLPWTAIDLTPWGKAIDSSLAPCSSPSRHSREMKQGWALLHQADGWTALSFWDRSGDSRGNSNSTFLVEETTSFDDLLARARETWPQLFDRFDFDVVQVDAPCRLEDPRREAKAAA